MRDIVRLKGHRLERYELEDVGIREAWYGWRCTCDREYDTYGYQVRADHREHVRAERAQIRLERWAADGKIPFEELNPPHQHRSRLAGTAGGRKYRHADVARAYA